MEEKEPPGLNKRSSLHIVLRIVLVGLDHRLPPTHQLFQLGDFKSAREIEYGVSITSWICVRLLMDDFILFARHTSMAT